MSSQTITTDPLNLTTTFEDPGVFPKYLCTVQGQLALLDLATIVALSRNGIERPAAIFNWILDKDLDLKEACRPAPEYFPEARENPEAIEPLLYMLEINGEYFFRNLKSAGANYDSGHVQVDLGPYVIDPRFRVWKMSSVHKSAVSNEADEYSASK